LDSASPSPCGQHTLRGAVYLAEARFPLAFACFEQGVGAGETFDERPRIGSGPVLEGFQRGGVILAQGLAELVDECGALLNEGHFVSAQDAQPLDEGIFGAKGAPGVAVGAQGIGKRPGVVTVGLGAAGVFALAIAACAHGIDRIDGGGAVDDLFNNHAKARLSGDAKLGIGADFFLPLPPTGGGVLDLEVGHQCAGGIDDDDVMMIAGPVETSEVGEFCMWSHGFGWLEAGGLRLAGTGSSCYMSFTSLSSIGP